jgi:hypothetical protein
VNHKRVGRILREDNLLCIRRRKFVCTTDSNHSFRVYPNLAGKMELTGVDQLWIADITYIRLETEFVYLASDPAGLLQGTEFCLLANSVFETTAALIPHWHNWSVPGCSIFHHSAGTLRKRIDLRLA